MPTLSILLNYLTLFVMETVYIFPDIFPFMALSESDQEKNEMNETSTSFSKDFAFHIYSPIPASMMTRTTPKAALEILLFDMKIHSAGSCKTLLSLSTRLTAVTLSLR